MSSSSPTSAAASVGPARPGARPYLALRALVPRGERLPEAVWRQRHAIVVAVLVVHFPALALFGVLQGYGAVHSVLETSAIAVAAVLASSGRLGPVARSALASLGLVTSSAILVHFWGGFIEGHFHFFFVVVLLALYQSWTPFVLGLAYVVVHHGVVGTLDPSAVYNHAAAIADPWAWALIHGGFVLAISAATLVTWRLNEDLLREVEEKRADSRNVSILNSAGDGIYGVDLAGRITFANPAVAMLTGHAPGALVGRRAHDVLHAHDPAAGPVPPEHCAACRMLGDETTGVRTIGTIYRHRDGGAFPVELTTARLEDDEGGTVIVFKDVTERHELDRMKDELSSVVSHELRTPLTAIRGSLGLLGSGVAGELSGRGARMVDIAMANTDRLIRLIGDILDMERIASGTAELSLEPCDAASLVETAVESIRPLACEAEVTIDVFSRPTPLVADPDRIVQVLTNLLANAVQFSPPHASVSLRTQALAGEVAFEVQDTGPGIPSDELEAIFTRFHQVDGSDAREKGGTGLGLAIARGLVEQHGGRLWVHSGVGAGSTFAFALAMAPTDEQPVVPAQAPDGAPA